MDEFYMHNMIRINMKLQDPNSIMVDVQLMKLASWLTHVLRNQCLQELGFDSSFLIITCELCWLLLLLYQFIFHQEITKLYVYEYQNNKRHKMQALNQGKTPTRGNPSQTLPSLNSNQDETLPDFLDLEKYLLQPPSHPFPSIDDPCQSLQVISPQQQLQS